MTGAAIVPAVTLLDETDVVKRLIQHSTVLLGIVVLLLAGKLADRTNVRLSLAIIGAGLALFVLASLVRQTWDVPYKGQRIRFVNNPLRGEYLLVDGVPVASGELGFHTEMRAAIPSGDTVRVLADAGLFSFRCRILVEPPIAAPANGAVSDAQLLAEVRRRGIQA
jgi:hypothetical protein